MLQRARAAELRAFLDWGGAVLRPKGYHYVLPSGHHSRTFIRVAEALRADARAPRAIATWLFHGIHPDRQTSVVLDTGSLTPLVSELNLAAEQAGKRLAATMMLDSYPMSRFEYRRLLGPAEDTWVLGVLSVSSTGTLRQKLQTTLVETVGTNSYRLETLVTRHAPEESRIVVTDADGAGVHAPWVSLHDSSDVPLLPDSEQGCRACEAEASARLVRIDPTNMAAMVLPQPIRIVPQVVDGHRNRTLWETYEEIDPEASTAHSFHGPTGTRRNAPRLDGDANQVFFEPGAILAKGGGDVLVRRLAALKDGLRRAGREDKTPRLISQATRWCVETRPDVVIVDQDERDLFASPATQRPAFETSWAEVQARLTRIFDGAEPQYVFHDSNADGLEATFVDINGAPSRPPATRVAIVALGARTGVTLQRMFLDTRAHWGQGVEIVGVVVHAHPRDLRTWESIRNTFKDHHGRAKLVALWLACIPRRSPIAEEIRLLKLLDDASLSDDTRQHVALRIRHELPATLWSSEEHRLRPTSYFGEGLTAPRVLLAVGSAVQAARQEARTPGNPDWVVFDLPTIFRSYFDGLIHSSVLRWLEPSECWWGDREQDCVHLLQEVEKRSRQDRDWGLLLPELLLAAAQNKIPWAGAQHLLARAEQELARLRKPGVGEEPPADADGPALSHNCAPWLELGIAAVRQAELSDATNATQ